MAVLLSLLTAAFYGTSDFCGGLAAKQARLIQVVAGGHLVGMVGVLIASVLFADRFDRTDFLLGMAGGALGVCGIALLYRRLAIGPMQVVAPLTAITSAAGPAAWGLGSGESISTPAWIGVGLGLLAIALVSISGSASHAPITPAVVLESLLAGVGFGGFFIFLDATDPASAPWPVAGARVLDVVVLIPFMLVTRRPLLAGSASTLALIGSAGLLDTAANVTFLYATHEGLLTLVVVLSSLYPVATVVWARVVLSERMTRPQLVAFTAAMAATALIAAG